MFNKIIQKRAILDETRKYRYILTRKINQNPPILFIMLNPSTADEYQDDPTIRRIIEFTKSWGYGSSIVMNLFAYRSSDPSELKKATNPIGRMNDYYLNLVSNHVDKIIVAWGVNGNYLNRAEKVVDILPLKNKVFCLEKTKEGYPKHPLYIRSNIIPIPFGWDPNSNFESVIRKKITLIDFMT